MLKYFLAVFYIGVFFAAAIVTACSANTVITCTSATVTNLPQGVKVDCVTPTPTASPKPSPTPTLKPTATPTLKPATPSPSPVVTTSPSPIPTLPPATPTPTPIITATPTLVPTPTLSPTLAPTVTPTVLPSATPNVFNALYAAAFAEVGNINMSSSTTFSVGGASGTGYQRADGSYVLIVQGTPGTKINVTVSPGATLANIRNGSNPSVALSQYIGASETYWTLDQTGFMALEYTGPSVGATPTPSPTPAPTSTGAINSLYSSISKNVPLGGSYPYYPSSPFHQPLPANPVFVAQGQSNAWNVLQSPGNFNSITITENGSNGNDGSDPTYFTNGDGTSTTLACNKFSYSSYSCKNGINVNGLTTSACPLKMTAAGDSDHHVVCIDTKNQVEIDIWESTPLFTAAGQTWSVGGAGECPLNGNGTGCSGSYATNIAGSLGLIRAEDIIAALDSGNANAVLPTALSIATKCNGTGVEFPATSSDAQCGAGIGTPTTRPAEGTRLCINQTDAQINAGPWTDYEKVVYRTADCQHYGMFIRDTSWGGAPGFGWQQQGGQAYTAYGMTDPWATLAARENISKQNGTDYIFPFNWQSPPMVYCANTKNDGLCD